MQFHWSNNIIIAAAAVHAAPLGSMPSGWWMDACGANWICATRAAWNEMYADVLKDDHIFDARPPPGKLVKRRRPSSRCPHVSAKLGSWFTTLSGWNPTGYKPQRESDGHFVLDLEKGKNVPGVSHSLGGVCSLYISPEWGYLFLLKTIPSPYSVWSGIRLTQALFKLKDITKFISISSLFWVWPVECLNWKQRKNAHAVELFWWRHNFRCTPLSERPFIKAKESRPVALVYMLCAVYMCEKSQQAPAALIFIIPASAARVINNNKSPQPQLCSCRTEY